MAANEVDPGPAMRHVVDNVRRLRGELRLSQAQLAARLTEVGRPIRATGLHRLETGRRRVDADDLVGLALALGVSPISLLLPPVAEGDVQLTETVTATAAEAWAWLQARRPLRVPADDDGYAVADFLRMSLPRGIRQRYPATPAGRELMLSDHPELVTRTVADIKAAQEGGEHDGQRREAP